MRKRLLVDNKASAAIFKMAIENADQLGFDTESSGPLLLSKKMLNVYKSHMVGFSVATDDYSFYIPVRHKEPAKNIPSSWLKPLLQLITEFEGPVWAHNWKHDRLVLELEGFEAPAKAYDSLVACWLANIEGKFGRYGLKALSEHHLKRLPDSFDKTVGKGKQFEDIAPITGMEYACADAINTLLLGDMAWKQIEERKQEKLFLSLETTFIDVLAHIERTGMRINKRYLQDLSQELDEEITTIRAEWETNFPGVLISSTKQLKEAFYDTGLWSTRDIEKTAKGNLKIDRKALEIHKDRHSSPQGQLAAKLKLRFQDISKFRNTYTTSLVEDSEQYEDDRLHPSFHHTGTATGRLSCSAPNLQNIPVRSELGQKIKSAFVPREGFMLVAADYSQIELRVLAHLAEWGALFDAYKENKDIHQQTADLVGSTRQQAKTINFATVYGSGPRNLGKLLGISTGKAKAFLKGYFDAYPEVQQLRTKVLKEAHENGYVETLTGRRRYLDFSTEGSELWRAERLAFNTPVQGGAADITKIAMVNLYKHFKKHQVLEKDVFLVGQVHDEITLEVRDNVADRAAQRLKELMESAYPLKVPLIAEPAVGKTWADCK